MKQDDGLEILAPAGSRQSLEAAVACGADAVYLGIDAFNARRNAENFTAENLAETVRFCHIRGVKVYLTLNIVVLEKEIPQLVHAAKAACDAGIDAVIVQDLGVAAILRRCAPELRLNASTQMAVHNAEGVRICEELGFSRVVLARECSREEIAQIVRATSLEVEVFVHGALCMCVSGQCYMSAMLGARSGNRGLCAQPCRLPFSSGASDYALSLKDMSLIEKIQDLKEIGVRSLKIEGRMKRPEYVAAAVTACRAAMEGDRPDLESLQSVFSRSGFTNGYYKSARGIDMFGTRQKEDVLAAENVLGKLAGLYNSPKRHIQKVGCSFSLIVEPGEPASLAVKDCDGNVVSVQGAVPETARNLPLDAQRAKTSIEKTGGTPYRVDEVCCDIAEGLMLPASSLNALRRDALEKLDEIRGRAKKIVFDPSNLSEPKAVPWKKDKPELRLRLCRSDQLTSFLMENAQMITLPVVELLKLLEKTPEIARDRLCAGIPRILFSGQAKLRAQLKTLFDMGIRHAGAGNLGAIEIARELGFTIHAEPFLNIINSYALETVRGLGACDAALSIEASLDMAKRLQPSVPVGMTVYGHLPLMTVRNCPVQLSVGCEACRAGKGYLTDRKGEKLRTNCAYGCSEILNPVPLYMGDRMDELLGIHFATLSFTIEPAAACERILRQFLAGEPFSGPYTRGLFYKTIL